MHPAAADSFSHFSPAHCLPINHCANSCDSSCEVLLGIVAKISGLHLRTAGEWLTPGWHDEERLSSSAEQPLTNDSLWLQLSLSIQQVYPLHLPEYIRELTFVLCVARVLKFSSLLITHEGWLHFLWNITGDTSHFQGHVPPSSPHSILIGTCGYFIFFLSWIPIPPQACVLATSLSPKKNNRAPTETH